MKLIYKDGYIIENEGKYWNHKKKMWCKVLKTMNYNYFAYQNEFEAQTQLNRLKATENEKSFANKINELMQECDLSPEHLINSLELGIMDWSIKEAFIEYFNDKGYTIIQPMDVVTEMEFMERTENLNITFA